MSGCLGVWGCLVVVLCGVCLERPAFSRKSRRLSLMRLVYRVRTGSAGFQRRTARRIRRQREVRALPMMLGLLRLSKAKMRRGGAIALGELGISWSGPLLLPLLKDVSPDVRRAAIEALGALKTRSAVPKLLSIARRGPKIEARMAIEALARIGDRAVVTQLAAWPRAKRRHLGILYSLTLASLGHQGRRKRWEDFWSRRPKRALKYLAGWRAPWAARFVFTRFSKASPSLKRSIARALLRRVSTSRARFLATQCQRQRLGKRFCQRSLPRYRKRLLPAFPKVPPPLFVMSQRDVRAWLRQLHRQVSDVSERFRQLTQRMLGTPYVLDALGEGPQGKIDRDPIFSLRKLDCVTFLEEAVALQGRADLKQAISFAQKIRYIGGKIDYKQRKHFPLLQWIPMMVRDGLAVDITRKLGGRRTSRITKTLTIKSYLSTREGRMMARRLGKERLITGRHHLDYLTLRVALRHLKKIPHGTILSVLRPAPATSPFQVAHQGVVVWIKGKPYMRHATKVWKSIVDVPLGWYLRSLTRYRYPRLGVHLLQIQLGPKKGLSRAPAEVP